LSRGKTSRTLGGEFGADSGSAAVRVRQCLPLGLTGTWHTAYYLLHMSWEVLLRPRAEVDLEEARHWYEAREVGLGAAFIEEAAAAMAKLQQAPDQVRRMKRI